MLIVVEVGMIHPPLLNVFVLRASFRCADLDIYKGADAAQPT